MSLPLGRKHLTIQNVWNGSPARSQTEAFPVNELTGFGTDVHRFKVDSVENTVIATGISAGLKVASMDTGELLWSLPIVRIDFNLIGSKSHSPAFPIQSYVTEVAHVEYDSGFAVFTKWRNGREVWRRSTDQLNPGSFLPCSPHPKQILAAQMWCGMTEVPTTTLPSSMSNSQHAEPRPACQLGRRGMYLPFALLEDPAPCRASRFVFPHVVCTSEESEEAYIWHVPTSMLVETIKILRPQDGVNHPQVEGDEFWNSEDEEEPQHINYVDLSDELVFVSWCRSVVAYRRPSKQRRQGGQIAFSIRLGPPLDPYPSFRSLWRPDGRDRFRRRVPPSTLIRSVETKACKDFPLVRLISSIFVLQRTLMQRE